MSTAGPGSPGPAVPSRFGPGWARRAGALSFPLLWRARGHGRHYVPRTGPVLLACNHVGFLDGPLLVAMSPRGVHCLIKSELFEGAIGLLMRATGQIGVRRESGSGDRAAMGAALAVLRRGGVVWIFPEGSRGRGDVAEVRTGIAWLAMRSGAPVVPVACLGARWTGESVERLPPFRRRLDVVFGPPVPVVPAPGVPGRVALVRAAEELRAVLARHVREAVEATGQRLPADDGPDGHGSGSGQGRNASGPDRRGSDPDGHEGDRDECERRGDRS